jgi:hypothetical protein
MTVHSLGSPAQKGVIWIRAILTAPQHALRILSEALHDFTGWTVPLSFCDSERVFVHDLYHGLTLVQAIHHINKGLASIL